MRLNRFFQAVLAMAFAVGLTFSPGRASATPVVIGDMSGVGEGGGVWTYASFEWHDLAVGFSVDSPGYVTRLLTSLRPDPSSLGSFVFGIASDDLVGTPLPDYFSPAPGSLWETNVCSTGIHPPYFPNRSACDGYPAIPGGPVTRVEPGEYFSTAMSLYLPAAGTYWLYTRHVADDVFSLWDIVPGEMTTLIAARQGSVTSGGEDYFPDDRTFFQAPFEVAALGFSVFFEPDSEVPEPSSVLLGLVALAGLVSIRQFRRSRRSRQV